MVLLRAGLLRAGGSAILFAGSAEVCALPRWKNRDGYFAGGAAPAFPAMGNLRRKKWFCDV